jgi:hypothetical protein
MLAVLAHMGGDHMDVASLAKLSRAAERSVERLRVLRLVQEPVAMRFALHATVKHALAAKTRFDPARLYEHYVTLLEREPARFELEEAHLFAALDYAHESGLDAMLRVDRLLTELEG